MKKIYSIAAAMLVAMAATAQTDKKCDNACANDSIVADTIVVYTLKTGKVGEGVVKGYKAIENGVVGGYKAIENGVVGGYKAIENGVVSGYKKIEEMFVQAFLNQEKKEVKKGKKNDKK